MFLDPCITSLTSDDDVLFHIHFFPSNFLIILINNIEVIHPKM